VASRWHFSCEGMWEGVPYSAARHGCYGFPETGWDVAEEDVESEDFAVALAHVRGGEESGRGSDGEAALGRVALRGHPRGLRPLAWAAHLALDSMPMGEDVDAGAELSSRGRATEATLRDIAKDVRRTFPLHPWIASESGAEALTKLLASTCSTQAGYTQGLNFLGGTLLLVLDPPRATKALVRICDTLGYWTPDAREGLVGLAVDQAVLGALVAEVQGPVAAHLRDVAGLDLRLMGVRWLLTLYATSLPPMCVLRLWDLLFSRWAGDPRPILFATALALVDRHRDVLLATRDAGEALAALNTLGRDLPCADLDAFLRAVARLVDVHAARVKVLRKRVLNARSWHAWWPHMTGLGSPGL